MTALQFAQAEPLERGLLASILVSRNPRQILDGCARLAAEHFHNYRHQVVWDAICKIAEAGHVPNSINLEERLQRSGHLEACGGVAFLGELIEPQVATYDKDSAIEWGREIVNAALARQAHEAIAEALDRAAAAPFGTPGVLGELIAELQRCEARIAESAESGPLLFGANLVSVIQSQAALPWVPFLVGVGAAHPEPVAELQPGESAFLMGPTGGGKSTLALGILCNHAEHNGPAILVSRELSAAAAAARAGALLADVPWSDVLGKSPSSGERFQEQAFARLRELPRFFMLAGEHTSLADIKRAISSVRGRFPGQPIMLAVDYLQIMEAERGGHDIRQNISSIVEALRRLVAKELVVGLMISQMSRSTSRLARAGELVGRDAADAGAESAAIERSAAVTLTIGEVSEPDAEGWRDVVLSRGKSRYGGGDTVFTLRQRGASGTTFVKGAASGQEVRQARASRREDAKQQQMRSAVMEAVRDAAKPLFKAEIRAALSKNRGGCNSAIAALVESGELVEVPSGEAARTRNPRFWDRERAAGLRAPNPSGSPPNAPPESYLEAAPRARPARRTDGA